MKELKPVFDAANKITSERVSPERERELFHYLHPITWIPCSERMPPDDESKYIFRDSWNYWAMYICKGRDYTEGGRSQDRVEWIPYDEATWRKLNELPNT